MTERRIVPAGTRMGDEGRYEILQRVGQGAMADVYRAVDRRLNGRVVAVKTLSMSIANHPFADKMRKLFIEEAQALSRVRDDNVVDVLDSGTALDGTPFMVMEFLNGRDLSVLLKEEKQISVERTVDLVLAISAGVHACHLAGIIHRDLKPANIFLEQTTKGEQPKVLDFSVAKVPVSRDQTRTDLIVGTPSYMSPEQALGHPADERSDQYSIGALIYRCLTGKPPQGLLAKPGEIRPDIPEDFEAVLLRAMDPVPANRHPSVHALGRSLLPFASPSGRLRWEIYYSELPPSPPSLSAIAGTPSPVVRGETGASTVEVPPYDFRAHERTTNAAAPQEMSQNSVQAPTTLASSPPFKAIDPQFATTGLESPSAPVMEPSREVASSAADPPSLRDPYRLRHRRRLIVGAPTSVVALAGIATAIYMASTRSPQFARPLPPAWTRSAPPAVVDAGPTVLYAVPDGTRSEPKTSTGPATEPISHPGRPLSDADNLAARPQKVKGSNAHGASSQVNGGTSRNSSARRRWLGGTTGAPSGGGGDRAKYPAVGTSDSKYPAMP